MSKHKTPVFSLKHLAGDFARGTGWLAMHIMWLPKIRSSGGKHISRQIKGNAIIICNHSNWFDPPCVSTFFPFRRLSVVTAKELFDGFAGKALRALGCVRLDREVVDLSSIHQCLELLSDGKIIAIFPEGRLNYDDEMDEFKPGAALLAAMTGAPIIPMYIAGNYKRFQRLQVIVGNRMTYADLGVSGMTADDLEKATVRLREVMVSLCDELESKMTPRQLDAAKECRRKNREGLEKAAEQQEK